MGVYILYITLSWQRESDISRHHGNRIYSRYILSSWQWESDISHCCGNMPGYISVTFHIWSIACMTSSLYYIQFNKCICNLASEYSFNCGFKFFLISLTWYILKWYISLVTWAIGICLIYMPQPDGRRPEGVGIYIRQIPLAYVITYTYIYGTSQNKGNVL